MQNNNTTPEFLTIEEVAQKLRICRRMYHRLVQLSELPHPIKIGSKSLIPVADLNAYIQKRMAAR